MKFLNFMWQHKFSTATFKNISQLRNHRLIFSLRFGVKMSLSVKHRNQVSRLTLTLFYWLFFRIPGSLLQPTNIWPRCGIWLLHPYSRKYAKATNSLSPTTLDQRLQYHYHKNLVQPLHSHWPIWPLNGSENHGDSAMLKHNLEQTGHSPLYLHVAIFDPVVKLIPENLTAWCLTYKYHAA
jgi:hypothetical protein